MTDIVYSTTDIGYSMTDIGKQPQWGVDETSFQHDSGPQSPARSQQAAAPAVWGWVEGMWQRSVQYVVSLLWRSWIGTPACRTHKHAQLPPPWLLAV